MKGASTVHVFSPSGTFHTCFISQSGHTFFQTRDFYSGHSGYYGRFSRSL